MGGPIDGRLSAGIESAARQAARVRPVPGEISLRQLVKHAAAVLDDLQRTGPLVVTRHGRPVARLAPLEHADHSSD